MSSQQFSIPLGDMTSNCEQQYDYNYQLNQDFEPQQNQNLEQIQNRILPDGTSTFQRLQKRLADRLDQKEHQIKMHQDPYIRELKAQAAKRKKHQQANIYYQHRRSSNQSQAESVTNSQEPIEKQKKIICPYSVSQSQTFAINRYTVNQNEVNGTRNALNQINRLCKEQSKIPTRINAKYEPLEESVLTDNNVGPSPTQQRSQSHIDQNRPLRTSKPSQGGRSAQNLICKSQNQHSSRLVVDPRRNRKIASPILSTKRKNEGCGASQGFQQMTGMEVPDDCINLVNAQNYDNPKQNEWLDYSQDTNQQFYNSKKSKTDATEALLGQFTFSEKNQSDQGQYFYQSNGYAEEIENQTQVIGCNNLEGVDLVQKKQTANFSYDQTEQWQNQVNSDFAIDTRNNPTSFQNRALHSQKLARQKPQQRRNIRQQQCISQFNQSNLLFQGSSTDNNQSRVVNRNSCSVSNFVAQDGPQVLVFENDLQNPFQKKYPSPNKQRQVRKTDLYYKPQTPTVGTRKRHFFTNIQSFDILPPAFDNESVYDKLQQLKAEKLQLLEKAKNFEVPKPRREKVPASPQFMLRANNKREAAEDVIQKVVQKETDRQKRSPQKMKNGIYTNSQRNNLYKRLFVMNQIQIKQANLVHQYLDTVLPIKGNYDDVEVQIRSPVKKRVTKEPTDTNTNTGALTNSGRDNNNKQRGLQFTKDQERQLNSNRRANSQESIKSA